jgi:Tol biopolymer transport system component
MAQEEHRNERPLQTWKDIAAYLERDVRTAMRWEKSAGLPIRRHAGAKGSSVYAYPSEIEAWRAGHTTESEPETPPFWRRPLTWAAAAVIAVAAAFIAYGPILNPNAPVAEAAEGSMRSEQVWTDEAAGTMTRISPDGKWATYIDGPTGNLWLRNVATGQSRVLTSKRPEDGVETSAISPDGKHVAVSVYNHDIYKYELRVFAIPPEGSTDNGVAAYQPPPDERGYVEVIGWLSNSRVALVHSYRTSIRMVITDIEQGASTVLKTFEWSYPSEAVASPDGHWIAYAQAPEPFARQSEIHLIATDGSSESAIVEHPADDLPVGWSPDGRHFLFRSLRTGSQSLWAVGFADGKLIGKPNLISPEFSAVRIAGLSPAGDLYYAKRTQFKQVYEACMDFETGRLIENPAPIEGNFVGDSQAPDYSPDGKRLAYTSNRSVADFGGYAETLIVIRDLATGKERTITPDAEGPNSLDWSPDSHSLLFRGRDRKGRVGVFVADADANTTRLLFYPDSTRGSSNYGWMPDGRSVYYKDAGAFKGAFWVYNLDSTGKRQILPEFSSARVALSPDGARFAIYDVLDKESVLSVSDIDSGQVRELHRWSWPEGFDFPSPLAVTWTPDSQKIVFWKGISHTAIFGGFDAELWTIPAQGGEARKTELAGDALAKAASFLSLHPDGQRIAFSAGQPSHEIWKLSNFLDRLAATD